MMNEKAVEIRLVHCGILLIIGLWLSSGSLNANFLINNLSCQIISEKVLTFLLQISTTT